MELLAVKRGDKYLRFLEESYVLGKMNKASVFPMDKVAEVLEKKNELVKAGLVDVEIVKLTISEEPFIDKSSL